MLRAIENIGVEMSLGLRFYARNELSRVSCADDCEHDDGSGDDLNNGDGDFEMSIPTTECFCSYSSFLPVQVNFAKFIEHQKLSIEYMKQVHQFYYIASLANDI